jgi:hypothetical protein
MSPEEKKRKKLPPHSCMYTCKGRHGRDTRHGKWRGGVRMEGDVVEMATLGS